jgi:hypothetical protein
VPYPWPSFGGFLFQKNEEALWESDAGWVPAPTYDRQKPLGSATDVITALSIGSLERTFEIVIAPDRYRALFTMLNSAAVLTDWERPIPDSRPAFLTELTPLNSTISTRIAPTGRINFRAPTPGHAMHVRLTFVSA